MTLRQGGRGLRGSSAGRPALRTQSSRPLVRPPPHRAVDLAADVPRGRLDLLGREFLWARLPGTPHCVLPLFTPEPGARRWPPGDGRGGRGGGGSGRDGDDGRPRVQWSIWLVGCTTLEQLRQQVQAQRQAAVAAAAGAGAGGGASTGGAAAEQLYVVCILRQEGDDSFSFELVGQAACGGPRGARRRRGVQQPARRAAPLAVRLPRRACVRCLGRRAVAPAGRPARAAHTARAPAPSALPAFHPTVGGHALAGGPGAGGGPHRRALPSAAGQEPGGRQLARAGAHRPAVRAAGGAGRGAGGGGRGAAGAGPLEPDQGGGQRLDQRAEAGEGAQRRAPDFPTLPGLSGGAGAAPDARRRFCQKLCNCNC